MSLKKQLMFAIYGFSFALLTLGMYAFYQTSVLFAKIDELSFDRIPSLAKMADTDMMHDNIKGNVYSAIYFSQVGDKEGLKTAAEENKEAGKRMESNFSEIKKLHVSDKIKKLIDDSSGAVTKYEATSNEIIELLLANKKSEATAKLPEFNKAFEDLEWQLGSVGEAIEKESGIEASNAQIVLIALGVPVLVFFFLGLIFGKKLLNRMSNTFTEHFGNLTQSSDSVKNISIKLSSANEILASGSTQSASSLEETAASLEELSSMVNLNSEQSNKAYQYADDAKKSTEVSDEKLKKLMEAISLLKAESKKMEEVVSAIDDIAFQTNILALNASVEAARAGEHGRGFAVVADAVRSLAQKSSSSAKEISGLIKENVNNIDEGYEYANTCMNSIQTVFTQIHKIYEINAQIAQASNEQASGLRQINQAMIQLDTSSQKNAATAEEVSRSAHESQTQSEIMRSSIDDLRSWVFGPLAHHAPVSVKPVSAQGSSPVSLVKDQPPKPQHGAVIDLGVAPESNEIKKVENF